MGYTGGYTVANDQNGSSGWLDKDPDPKKLLRILKEEFGNAPFKSRGGREHMALVEQGDLIIIEGNILEHMPLTFQVVSNGTSIDNKVEFHRPETFNTSSLEFDPHYDTFVEKFRGVQFSSKEFHQFIVDRIEGATIGTTNPLLMKLVRAGVVQETSPVGSKHIYGLTRNTLDDYTTRHSETAAQPYPLA